MKLRTDLIANVMLGNKVFPTGTDEDIEHDALAAHALLQAIEDAEDRWFVTQKDHTYWIKKKADELMREWTNQSEV